MDGVKGRQIVLTSDSTIMSSYHNGSILGLAGILPQSLIPKWIFSKLFCPEIESFEDGRAKLAPVGLRRIEASLLENGFDGNDVVIASPNNLNRVIGSDTRIVGITHDDPLGKIACHEVEQIMGKGPVYNRALFLQLLRHPSIRKYRPRIVVGGKGAWEVTVEMNELGIDHVLVGEGDLKNASSFRGKKMLQEHWELIGLCLEHNLKHAGEMFEIYSERLSFSTTIRLAWKALLKIANHKLREYVKTMKNGEAPFQIANAVSKADGIIAGTE